MSGLSAGGRDFVELRQRLERALGVWAPVSTGQGGAQQLTGRWLAADTGEVDRSGGWPPVEGGALTG